MRRATLALTLAAAALTIGACSKDANSLDAQARAGDQSGYRSGDGAITRLAIAQREAPVALSGRTVDGGTWDIASAKGTVVVINLWASWCPPCVEEMPALQAAWTHLQATGQPVAFIGVDNKESAETGHAFLKAHNVTYPSLAHDGGTSLLALQGRAPTLPTTLILDSEHRIAARVAGKVDKATLVGLVEDVLAGRE